MTQAAIERYEILEKIGAGGMITGYRMWDREMERGVSLKLIPAYFSADNAFADRFRRKANVIARLEHPHLVSIGDVGDQNGRP